MEVFKDWKLWAFIIQAVITIFGFALIKFNDFRHLESDVSEIKIDVKQISCKVENIDKELAVSKERIKNLQKSKR